MKDPQIIIVGAGAAGIGAALECEARGISYLVLEAAARVGGRAYTARGGLPTAWDWGCHWLHCADKNSLVSWADRLGANYVCEDDARPYVVWMDGAFGDAKAIAEYDDAMARAFDTLEASTRDVPIPQVLSDTGRWSPSVRLMLALMAGDDPKDVSASGYADYRETNHNWPVLSGLGALISAMGKGLNIRPGITVTGISQQDGGAIVTTDQGNLDAEGVIVTASTNVLTSGKIYFSPGPAADLLDAISQVPCGAYEKIAFATDTLPEELAEARYISVQQDGQSLATYFQIMQGDAPMLLCHIAGDQARALTIAGKSAMIDYARDALMAIFGAGIAKRIIGTATTNWMHDPLIMGSYSHVRPDAAQQRRDMIDADTGRVVFAGEAFSRNWQATAHGAYDSGRRAAARMGEFLSHKWR